MKIYSKNISRICSYFGGMKYLSLLLLLSCNNAAPVNEHPNSKKITDSIEYRLKIREFAAQMASDKIRQGYSEKQAKAYMDSILLAKGIDTAH